MPGDETTREWSFFVTMLVTEIEDSVTIATNQPCKLLIIRWALFSYTSPWEEGDFLHREMTWCAYKRSGIAMLSRFFVSVGPEV